MKCEEMYLNRYSVKQTGVIESNKYQYVTNVGNLVESSVNGMASADTRKMAKWQTRKYKWLKMTYV